MVLDHSYVTFFFKKWTLFDFFCVNNFFLAKFTPESNFSKQFFIISFSNSKCTFSMGNFTFYLNRMRAKQQSLLHLNSMFKRCLSMLTLLLTTLVLSAQSSSNVNASNNIAPDADAVETALACGLSLDHEDVYCGNSESGVITVNLSTNEVGDFTLNWTTDATPIPSSTVTITAGQIDGDTGLFQGDVVTIEGLTPGVYNLTVTTPEGLTCFAQATIFVTDFQAPIITCPLPIVANAPIGACEITIDVSNLAIATDSCGVIIESDIQEVTAGVGVTNFPVTYTATDGSGNVTTATCDIEVTVRDEEGPTIQCPTSISVDTDDSECGAVVEWGVTAEDNCPGVVVTTMCIFPDTTDPVACMSGMEYPIGTTLVLGTATDASGNQANCAFEIMVADGEPPVVDCPTNITVSNDAGECGAIVNFAPTATDNCGVVSNSTDIASGTFFELGTTTVTYTATDAAGNSTTCDFTVTVVDNEDPILVCPADATINTSSNGAGDCAAAVPNFIPGLTAGTNGSFSGNCSATVTQSPAPGTLWGAAHGDTQAVIITVTDVNGNTATCEVTLTLQDDERPTLTCPVAAISVGNTDGLCSAVVNFNVSANDNCTVALAGSHASGDTFPLGTTTVTYTATDAAGNTRSCSFNISVRDNEEPNVSCPSNIEIDNDPGECGAIATYNTSFTDNCPGGTDMISHASGSFFPVGTTTITYSALDASGLNGAICTFDVIVNDNEPPTVDPQDVTMQTGDNDVYDCIVTVPNYEDPIVDGAPNPLYNADDNCNVTVTQDPAPGTPFEDGGVCAEPIVVTITATDGITAVIETATVTLEDNVDPLITCPANITVTPDAGDCDGEEVTILVPVFVEPILDASGNPIAPTNPADPDTGAYTDDCDCVTLSGPLVDDASVTFDDTNTGTFPIGTTTVSYTATDDAGNSAVCTFTVTVLPPETVVVCNGSDISSATLDADTNCEATHSWPSPTVEACDTSTPISATCVYPDGTVASCAAGDTFPLGTTQITYPSASQCNLSVTVVDNTPPTVDPQDVTMQTGDNDVYDCIVTVPNYEDPIVDGAPNPLYNADDNCNVIVTQDPAPGTPFEDGGVCAEPIVVTITATDGVSTVTETATVTLEDNVDPLITCPANITVTPDAGDCDGEEVTILVPVFVEPTLDASGNPIAPTNPADPDTGAYTDDCDCVTLSGPLVDDASVTLDDTNTGTFPIGTTTLSYTATDDAGNSAVCTFTVTVLPPETVVVCNGSDASSATLDADTNCEATHSWPSPTVEACDTSTPINATCVYPDGTVAPCAAGDTFPLGITQITYPSASQCNLSVTVVDNTPPTVNPQDITMQTGDNDVYDCIVTVPNYEDPIVDGAANLLYNAADNCSVTVTQDPAPGTPFEDGGVCAEPIVVTITATDGVSTVTETATVTLEDNVDPLITCPADITALDGCDGAEVTIPVPVFVEPILDASGNATTPTNPADPATGAYTDDCDCVVLSGPTTDNGVVLDASNTATFPLGVTTLTYTATDAAGNTATCTFTVTVDTPASVIVCNGSDEASATYDANENCEALHTWPSPTIEACDSSTPIPATCLYPDGTSAPCASGDAFPLGTTDVTFADADQCNFTVTVEDTPPTFDADPAVIPTSDNGVYDCGVEVPNYIDATLADGSANPFWINLEDNCGAVATQDPAPGTVFGTCHEDTQDVVINIFDDNNGDGVADNTTVVDTETVTITLIDDVDPLIACPANVVINTSECEGVDYTALPFNLVEETLDADGNPLPLDPYTYADDCSTAAGCLEFELVDSEGVTLADGDSGTGTFPPGTTTLTYTVTDGAGNTATCSYTVTVIVEEMFTLNCPSNVKVPNDLGECGADVYWNPPIVTGSCTGDSGGSAPATSCVYPDGTTGPCGIGSFFPVGITVVTYEGVMPACSFEVRVLDTEKPIIECPEDITVSVAGAGCKAWVSWNKPTPSDNCGVVSMNGTHINTGMYFLVGTTTVIYKAADAAGNTGTCNFTITVIDDLDPAASCPDDITLAAPGTATWTPPNPVDNCVADGVLIQATHEPGAFFDETTTVTYMFEDAAGNIDECSFTVNVDAGASPRVAGRVAMEGASMNGGGMMRDDLRMSPLMPNSFGLVTPYGGSSATSTITLSGASNTNSAVDWILIEIRDANNPAQVLMTRSALVQRDGDIMAADGSSSITLAGLSNGNYHVAVRHRNHLGVMTATPVYLDANAPMLDFTDANFQTWGTDARVNVNGKMVMIAGDATGDGAVTAADRSDIWNNRNTQSYMTQDCDMNGATTAADRNISYNNRNTIEQLPQ